MFESGLKIENVPELGWKKKQTVEEGGVEIENVGRGCSRFLWGWACKSGEGLNEWRSWFVEVEGGGVGLDDFEDMESWGRCEGVGRGWEWWGFEEVEAEEGLEEVTLTCSDKWSGIGKC